MVSQKVIKVGHSLAVTIPVDFCKTVGVKSGDEVKIDTAIEKGRICYHFPNSQQLLLLTGIFSKSKK